jgi:type IV pilus assembly protein PilP
MQDTVPTILRAGMVFAALGLLSACSDGLGDLRKQIAEAKEKPGRRIQPLPDVKPYEAFAYSAGALRSPFLMSLESSDAPSGPRPNSKRAREFLEQYSLDTLRMVGTLRMGNAQYGLVQSRDGLIHRVLPGNYMGQNDGRVISVTDARISLIEIVPDGLGGYIERPAAVALAD